MINLLTFYLQHLTTLGYPAIIGLMAMESSILPVPSELVMAPAGYLASLGQLNIFWVIASGTVGSLLGAWLNYGLAFGLGRPLLYQLTEKKSARLLLLSPTKVARAKNFSCATALSSTFLGQLVPVVRHLISIPAGLAKMSPWKFSLWTTTGALVWNTVLVLLGYYFGARQNQLQDNYKIIVWLGLIFFGILIIVLISQYQKSYGQKK